MVSIEEKFKQGEKIVVAISGGPDSMTLLDMLRKLQPKLNLKLIVAHVNYNLRGKDSLRDEKLVIDYCKQHNLTYKIKRIQGLSLHTVSEEHLRDLRYHFFQEILKKYHFNRAAIAHTLDDQIETVLMRILRGSGLRGLRGILVQREKFIRPLLDYSRKDTLSYCKKYKVPYRIDRSNTNLKFFRNQVRLKVIPYLKKYSPDILTNLKRLGKLSQRDYSFIEKEAKKFPLKKSKKELFLDYKEWLKLHPALKYEVLRQAILQIKGDLNRIKLIHLDQAVTMLDKGVGRKHKVLPGGLKIELLNAKIKLVLK